MLKHFWFEGYCSLYAWLTRTVGCSQHGWHTHDTDNTVSKTDNTVCNDSAPSVQTEAACPVRAGLQVGCSPAAWPKWTPWSPRRGKWSSNSCL